MALTSGWTGIMTTERDQDPEATVQMPRPTLPVAEEPVAEELEDVDPEQTLVREDWESTVIRRVAPHIAEVQSDIEAGDESFGWESEGLRRLSRELQSKQVNRD
jgi:hypothetical protein